MNEGNQYRKIITAIIAVLHLWAFSNLKVSTYIPEEEVIITKNIYGKVIKKEENISYIEYSFRSR